MKLSRRQAYTKIPNAFGTAVSLASSAAVNCLGHDTMADRGDGKERQRPFMTERTVQAQAHAVIWIDYRVAKIFSVGLTGVSASAVRAHSSFPHHKASARGDLTFLARVSEALGNCTDLLIIGPGNEKTELMQFLKTTRSTLTVHVESSDHPTEREIVALGRKRFHLD